MTSLRPSAVKKLYHILSDALPEPEGELQSVNDYTFLVAVVLSAQATDKSVNKATKALFENVQSPKEMVALGEEALKTYIKTINLYPTKAKRIIALSELLLEKHNGQVPETREALEALPGVGRKTANVVLNVCFAQPTLAVDTHILRLSNRTGLSDGKTPRMVEEDLLKVTPEKFLLNAHHWLLLHGRYTCTARNPQCESCILSPLCLKNNL